VSLTERHSGRAGAWECQRVCEQSVSNVSPVRRVAFMVPTTLLSQLLSWLPPAFSAWEAGEPTSQGVFQAQARPFEGPFWWLIRRVGALGARAVDQDGHRSTWSTLTAGGGSRCR